MFGWFRPDARKLFNSAKSGFSRNPSRALEMLKRARRLQPRDGMLHFHMAELERFGEQPEEYRNAVLPPSIRTRVSVEAGVTLGWERYVGEAGAAVGIDRFGASAPGPRVFRELGITAEAVAARAKGLRENG